MTLSKKGLRRICVDGAEYLWKIGKLRYDDYVHTSIVVQPADRQGCVLIYRVAKAYGGADAELKPSLVADCIRDALAEGWQPRVPGSPFDFHENYWAKRHP